MEDALSAHEATGPVTGEELLRMPWLNPCELVGGHIVRMTPTNPTHGRIEVNVAAALRAFVRTQTLGVVMAGEVGVFTTRNPDTVRAPDVLYLSHRRDAHHTRRDGFLEIAPDLVVEILSPDGSAGRGAAQARRVLRRRRASGVGDRPRHPHGPRAPGPWRDSFTWRR